MSNEKTENLTAAPDYMKFGFKNSTDLQNFLNSDIGKVVQSEQVATYMEQKRNEEILANYFTEQDAIRRAVVAAILIEEEEEEEQTKQKQAEAGVQAQLTAATAPPKVSQPSAESPESLKDKLDSVNKDIIHSAKKHKAYNKAADVAQAKANIIDRMSDADARKNLNHEITKLEAKQKDLQERMMTLDDRDPQYEEKLKALVDENNTNEVRLGIFRTLRDVKEGKLDMYDTNGNKTDKFSEARFTVPKDKELLKEGNSFYLIDRNKADEKLSVKDKLDKHPGGRKNAAENFKKEEPNMLNVKEFIEMNRKGEMKYLTEKQTSLINQLDNSKDLNKSHSDSFQAPDNTKTGAHDHKHTSSAVQSSSKQPSPRSDHEEKHDDSIEPD